MKILQASDGIMVPVSWVNNGHDTVILFCHGITSDRDENGIFSNFYYEYCIEYSDAFYFDFRGHGQSDVSSERATIVGMRDDFRTSISFLYKHGYKRIIIIAASFGASIILLESHILRRLPVHDIIFWNPVVSYVDTFVKPLTDWARGFFPGNEPCEESYTSCVQIPGTDFKIGPLMAREICSLVPENIELPKDISYFCIHGTSDRHVPYSSTEKFCQRNKENAQLYSMKDGVHGFPDQIDELYKATAEWLISRL